MENDLYKKVSIVVISILFVVTAVIPVVNAQFTKSSANKEIQNSGKNDMPEAMTATVYMKRYDQHEGRFVKEPIKEITRDEAARLKEELLSIERTYSSSKEKIREQMEVMHRWDLLPSDVTFDEFVTVMERMEDTRILPNSDFQPRIMPEVIVCGPVISSFLAVGGSMFPLHTILSNLLPPWWYNSSNWRLDILNGTRIAGFIGIMPVAAFYCTAMTLINVFGLKLGQSCVISPFISIMAAHVGVGISVSIFDDAYPVNILDWGVGVSLTGLIAYISRLNP